VLPAFVKKLTEFKIEFFFKKKYIKDYTCKTWATTKIDEQKLARFERNLWTQKKPKHRRVQAKKERRSNKYVRGFRNNS